mgnify:CR=1 FL=1
MWYSDLYRRHLLDMHIEDWNSEFLSEFSVEEYIVNLKKAQINYAMIYFQSHVGLCYFPTKTGTMHASLKKDPYMIKKLVDECHKNSIRVCGYYSLIYNTREHDKHPEWRMLSLDGKSSRGSKFEKERLDFASAKGARYGFCCPSNPEYREFVCRQIDEMLEFFDADAFFFDMPFWPHTCYCKYCREKYIGYTGHEMPDRVYNDTPEYYEITEFKYRAMGEFIQSVTDYVKKKRPDMPVEHNYAQSIASTSACGCGEEVNAACDYVGGDLYGSLYNHSFACKYFRSVSKNQPFEQMFSRCKPALWMHTLTKTTDEMKTALAVTMAHHGATLVIDAIDPIGTMDSRVYDRIGEVFEFQKPYEKYFSGKCIEDVGIYYGTRSRVNDDVHNSRECCRILGETLIRAHIPFGVTGSVSDISRYPVLIAPVLSRLEEKDNGRLAEYVENGGVLYISGCGNKRLVEELTGNTFERMTEEKNLYIAPTEENYDLFGGFTKKYPLTFVGFAPVMKKGDNCKVLATLTFPYTKPNELKFASIHSDPPGRASAIPALTVNSYGKGRVIWSALPIEAMEYAEYREIFLNIIESVSKPKYSLLSDAPHNVEIVSYKDENSFTVNVSVLCEESKSVPVVPFKIRIKTDAKPSRVILLPNEDQISFSYEDGYTIFKTRTLNIFDMYKIDM